MKKNIGIIGGGNMGSAILDGVRRHQSVLVCEKDPLRARELKKKFKIIAQDLTTVIKKSRIVILAVKPQDFDSVLEEMAPAISSPLVISIAAGITTRYIEQRLGGHIRVIRAMPNLPAQAGAAVTGLCKGAWAADRDLKSAQEIFKRIGRTVIVGESLMDAVTAVSGSGPAYLFYFVECFKQAALNLGLKDEISQTLVLETLKGSLALLEKSKEDAGALRRKVTSKGGTTEAALAVFEQNKFAEIFARALAAARDRARELAK